MNGSLDSPPVSPRRPILACLALFAGAILVLGCGSESEKPTFSEEDAAALTSRLDAINEDVNEGDCSGSSNAFTRIDAMRDQVEASEGINEQGKSDLTELIDELEAQVTEECEEAESTSTTTSSTTTEDTTTEEEPTTTEETTTETTTEKTTTEEEPTTTEEPETPEPPSNGNGPPGGTPPGQTEPPPSGGVGPGFESGRKVPG
jgi:hypothetical protein